MVGLQATVKRDNGQSELVPLFHEQENVSGEVGYRSLGLVAAFMFLRLYRSRKGHSQGYRNSESVCMLRNHFQKNTNQQIHEPDLGYRCEPSSQEL